MWHSIVNINEKSIFIDKINQIYSTIQQNKTKVNTNLNSNLVEGNLGIILFLTYYSIVFDNAESKRITINLIQNVIENIDSLKPDASLFTGLSGLGWVLQFLINIQYIEFNDSDLQEIDEIILRSIIDNLKFGNFDLISGGIGQILYLLERNPSRFDSHFFERVIKQINYLKLSNNGYSYWNNIEYWLEVQTEKANLGLAHGTISISYLLSKLYQYGYAPSICQRLIHESISFYKYCRKQDTLKSIFPTVYPFETSHENSRLAWCNGDLGIGISILQIGIRLKDELIQDFGNEILLSTTTRKNLKVNGVFDSSFCHGTSGIGHIYNKAYQYTKDVKYKEASKYWFTKTLELAKFEDGYAGYKTWFGTDNESWKNELGLLTGISGVGLSLISFVSDISPDWDKIFLLS